MSLTDARGPHFFDFLPPCFSVARMTGNDRPEHAHRATVGRRCCARLGVSELDPRRNSQADRRARPWPGSAKMAAPCCFFRTGSYSYGGMGAAFDSIPSGGSRHGEGGTASGGPAVIRRGHVESWLGPSSTIMSVTQRARGFDVSLFPLLHAYYCELRVRFWFHSVHGSSLNDPTCVCF